ncbi:MAG: hypothetical protein KAJ18_01675 [Candidatus Omnitrophica bacterium]|nr:hypothetical protein [Candidatus Omnitrophota bacterium]
MNPNRLEIETRGQGMDAWPQMAPRQPLPPEELRKLETMPFDGFMPVIFQIIPVTNFPLLQGKAEMN